MRSRAKSRTLARSRAQPAAPSAGPRHRLADIPERVAQLALGREVERIVPSHQQRVRPDLHHRRLAHGAVHALAAHQEEQIRLEARDLLEVLGDGIHAAIERMPGGEIGEDLPAGEDRRLERLGQPHRLGLRPLARDVVAEHEQGAPRLGQAARDGLDGLRARGRGSLDLISGAFPDLGLQPLAEEQLRADGEIDGPGGRRGRLPQRADGRHRDRGRVRVHLVGRARLLGERPHRLRLAQPREGREPAIVLELGGPVPGDDQDRGARHLGIEELAGELVRAAHHVRDDHAHLAADPVIAVGHGRHQPFVLAHHQALVAVLRDGGEDPGLGGARIGEEVFHPRVLERLQEEHSAGAGDRLAHGRPRGHAWAVMSGWRTGASMR